MSEAEPEPMPPAEDDAKDAEQASDAEAAKAGPLPLDGSGPGHWPNPRVEAVVEALLFASPEPVTFRTLRGILPEAEVSSDALRAALDAIAARHESTASGVRLQQVSGGWQFLTHEDCFAWVQCLAKVRSEEKITSAALETLAIIAYKQPITRAEIDGMRGVGSGQMIRTLMDKEMVRVVGRVDLPGRPFQYGTTRRFLEHFGLASLKDLPQGKDL